jgi:hypothetical protein
MKKLSWDSLSSFFMGTLDWTADCFTIVVICGVCVCVCVCACVCACMCVCVCVSHDTRIAELGVMVMCTWPCWLVWSTRNQ